MDLLSACREPVPKTRLYRQANMNHDQGERYLELSLDEDLVRRVDGHFVVSETGEEILEDWRDLEDVVAFEGP